MLKALYAALESLSSAIPAGLGAIAWLGYKIGPDCIAPMVLAMMCALAVINLSGALSARPMVYAPRFFEISLLVGFVDSFVPKLGSWGLPDTSSVRLTLVVAACVGAALLQPLLYGLRLQRMTRYIPSPVFSGFLNSVSLILIISQIKQILLVVNRQPQSFSAALLIAFVCFGTAYATKRARPNLPAGILGLAASSLTGAVLHLWGQQTPSIMPTTLQWVLPVTLLDWAVFDPHRGALMALLWDLSVVSFLLAMVVFLNTIMAVETLSQVDERPSPTLAHTLQVSFGKIVGACLGSVPVSGSPPATLAAMRTGGLGQTMFPFLSVLVLAFYALDLLAWLPQTAMIGLLLFEAYCLMDRNSLSAFWQLVREGRRERPAMSELQREDLLIVSLVTLFGVLVNMVAGVLVGIILGLFLFAKRNSKSPVKDIYTGRTVRSNCARSQADTRLLEQHGTQIQCARLQGALYFGVARLLRTELEQLLPGARWLVLDWGSVVSEDTTVLRMFERFEKAALARGVSIVHCAHTGDRRSLIDLDRALEYCENQLLQRERGAAPALASTTLLESGFFAGLDADAKQRASACFESRRYASQELVLKKGDRSRELHLIAQGSANVVIAPGRIRVAGVSAGAVLGEMGFLDGTPRAADVYAAEDMVTYVLSRERFDLLSQSHPEITQRILHNLCGELASRLRSMHVLLARESV